MLTYAVRRLLSVIPVMAVVAIVIFLLVRLAPGDPAVMIAGENATDDDVEQVRLALGLNRPLWEQFFVWISAVLQGDLGQSVFTRDPVAQLMLERAEPTIALASTTLLTAASIAVLLGVAAAAKAGSGLDRGLMAFAALSFSMPGFVVGYLLIFVFAITLRWLPVQGYVPLAEGFWAWLPHIVLPTLTLSLAYIALISRITRAAMLEVLAEDYIRTADAKGVPASRRLLRHALKNAAVPIVTIIGMGFALLVGGVVITETVFNVPGVGRLVVDAIGRRDYPIIQGAVLVFSAVYVLINLLVDLSYALFDPRIRY